MGFFTKKVKTDKELQDELKALVDKVIAMQTTWPSDMDRYENLLKEIYSRNLTPAEKLITKVQTAPTLSKM